MENTSTTTPVPAELTVGIDVSDKYSQVCILDGLGEVMEESRVRTTEAALRIRFSSLRPARTVIEVGPHSPWLSRLLRGLGHECIVANPRRLRLIADSTRKNDRADAETLARVGRADPSLLAPVEHRSEQAQADLALIHSRRLLVESRTSLVNRVRAVAKSFGARLPASGARAFAQKVTAHIPDQLRPATAPLLRQIVHLNEEIADLDRQIEALIKQSYPQARLLQQVPGVGPLIALAYVLTIGEPQRFPKSRHVGAYLGLVPRERSSGDSRPELSITKSGNVYMRQLLVNGAHYILGHFGADSDLRRWGLRKAEGGKSAKKRAVIAVARKLAVLLHRLWATGEVYTALSAKEVTAAA